MAKKYCSSCDGTGKWKYGDPEYHEECVLCDGTGIDTSCMDEIICPYCAEILSTDDRYESGLTTCEGCQRDIQLEIEYTPSYSTFKKE